MSQRRLLRANLTLSGEKVKVRWMSPQGALPKPSFDYSIQFSELKERIKACRAALDGLQGVADDPPRQRLPLALQQVALSGKQLYEVLMTGGGGRPAEAESFRTWFEATVEPAAQDAWRIEFQHDRPETAVPWGITCATGAATGNGVAFDDYVNLWAHRYIVACYTTSNNLWEGHAEPIPGGAFQCSILTEAASPNEQTQFNLRVADHDGTDTTMWLTTGPLSDHTISRVSALRDKFRDKRDWNHIVYLNLCASGGQFSLPNDQEALTPDKLQQITALLRNSYAIAMIDREAIIRGDRGNDWLGLFFHERWAGLIAAETDIPAKALRFRGFRFLMALLVRGEPLTESLFQVRKDLWPYSLLYGVYSNPERVFVRPPPDVVKELKAALEARG